SLGIDEGERDLVVARDAAGVRVRPAAAKWADLGILAVVGGGQRQRGRPAIEGQERHALREVAAREFGGRAGLDAVLGASSAHFIDEPVAVVVDEVIAFLFRNADDRYVAGGLPGHVLLLERQ